MQVQRNTLGTVSVLFLLSACGGGGGNSDASTPDDNSSEQTPAVIAGTDTGTVAEDGLSEASGTLTISDEQSNEASFIEQANANVQYGTFSISTNGQWSYTLDQSLSSVNSLAANDTEIFTIEVMSVDGTTHDITITLTGANDVANFEFDNTPTTIDADETDTLNGNITITDIDDGEGTIVEQSNQSYEYGVFTITASGAWTYQLDTNNEFVSALTSDQTLTETLSIVTDDGTSSDLVVTINGVLVQPGVGDFVTLSETIVSSDGVNTGLSAYELIENAFADGSIEAPDFYASNHTEVEHIIEDEDEFVGPHFVFLAHRDDDHDRGGEPSDRQRNEIKTYDQSDEDLKSYEGETFQYQWKFKVSSDMELSSRFSHFFQIKAKNYNEDNSNGNDNQPIFTLSGAEKTSTGNELQVRYNSGYQANGDSTSDVYLQTVDWDLITDEWLEVFVQITYSENGKFDMTVTRMRDDAVIINLSEDDIDTWRGVQDADFVRPKWGIYRSILETDSLRADEERVRFADFTIRKGSIQ